MKEAQDRLDRPIVRLDERVTGDIHKSRLPQYALEMFGAAARQSGFGAFVALGTALCPSMNDVGNGLLPALFPPKNAMGAQRGQPASRFEPSKGPCCYELLVEAMESRPYGDQFKRIRRCFQVFGPADLPSDALNSPACRLALPCLDHLRFEIDSAHLPKRWGKIQGHPAGSACQIEKTTFPCDRGCIKEGPQKAFGIGNAVPYVVGSRASKGVGGKVRFHAFNRSGLRFLPLSGGGFTHVHHGAHRLRPGNPEIHR